MSIWLYAEVSLSLWRELWDACWLFTELLLTVEGGGWSDASRLRAEAEPDLQWSTRAVRSVAAAPRASRESILCVALLIGLFDFGYM